MPDVTLPESGRTPAENAQLALLLEVAGTPKPGNVDRHRDHADLHFEHFLAGAVGARVGLEMAADGAPVGEAFETAVEGMARQSGGNTQFGCLLLLVPLVRAAAADACTPAGVTDVVEATTVDDAVGFYRAFDHVDVAVDHPPSDAPALDVRRGGDAAPALRERGVTLSDVMDRSVPGDGDAAEWVGGFERTFRAADAIVADDGPLTDRAARAYLDLLAEESDTFVATTHGAAAAEWVRDRAAALRDRDPPPRDVEGFGDALVAKGVNPGTTADLTCAALFVALERGVAP
ncbi:MAG: triphosphoribosyl-dephospho-CoA synthase [Halobacteriaceae archaeon]